MKIVDRAENTDAGPKIGIFWVVRGSLIVKAIPANKGERYGDSLTYEHGHHTIWSELQRQGTVPTVCEYEEFPRGRVSFNRRTQSFLLLADRCILSDSKIIAQIMQELNLPKDSTTLDTDSHYRCLRCLNVTGGEEI